MNLFRTALLGLLCSVLASVPLGAKAVGYIGNPNLNFWVDRPAHDYTVGTVDLDKVRIHHCAGGSTDYQVDNTIDPVDGYSVPISAGNECGATFFWSSVMDISGSGFTVRYSQSTTNVTFDTEIDPVYLSPYSVVSGSMSGNGPWLYVTVN